MALDLFLGLVATLLWFDGFWDKLSGLTFGDFYSSNWELVGVITGIANVLLLTMSRWPRLQWFNWPVAQISNIIYFFLFWQWGLYGNMILQPFFIVICFMGLWTWRGQLRGVVTTVKEVPTRWASFEEVAIILGAVALAMLPTYFILEHFKDPEPFWDGLILTLSIGASILQWRKKVQSWMLWIAVDAIAVPFHWSQGYPATSFLYFVYGVICVYGLYEWVRDSHTPPSGQDRIQDISDGPLGRPLPDDPELTFRPS